MIKYLFTLTFAFILSFLIGKSFTQTEDDEPIKDIVTGVLDFSVKQSLSMAYSLKDKDGLLPKSIDKNGNLETCDQSWWTCGFFPGTLWYLYEYSGSEELKTLAQEFSSRVKDQQFTKAHHDVGFIINCSFGNGYRLIGNDEYKNVIHNAANTLITRFRKSTGCIRSWDKAEWNKQWQYPVIIDNMMNLELLLFSAREFNESKFYDIAVSHANTTIKNHYRPDYSSFHVVSYDTITGEVEYKHTSQGYSHNSSWARGQAWGIYGFTMMYRFTKDTTYLSQAKHIADFLIHHPRLPDDKIPYWDYDAPDIPDSKRDVSAASIMCSALIELSKYAEPKFSEEFLSVAETQIRSLCSSNYRNEAGTNGNFILNHCVGHMPNETEVDVPLSYADYYFVEALMKYKELKGF